MVQDMHLICNRRAGGKAQVTLTVEAGYLAQRGGIFQQVIQKHLPCLGLLPQLLLCPNEGQARPFLHQR